MAGPANPGPVSPPGNVRPSTCEALAKTVGGEGGCAALRRARARMRARAGVPRRDGADCQCSLVSCSVWARSLRNALVNPMSSPALDRGAGPRSLMGSATPSRPRRLPSATAANIGSRTPCFAAHIVGVQGGACACPARTVSQPDRSAQAFEATEIKSVFLSFVVSLKRYKRRTARAPAPAASAGAAAGSPETNREPGKVNNVPLVWFAGFAQALKRTLRRRRAAPLRSSTPLPWRARCRSLLVRPRPERTDPRPEHTPRPRSWRYGCRRWSRPTCLARSGW